MQERIILLALIVAALSLAAAGIMYFRFRRVVREKNHSLARILYDRDRVERELERSRIEKVLLANLSQNAETSDPNNDKPLK
ncbi:hypothetical protein [uncultured Sanguibacteroides sp.]|uniref:hypothetical protein n=1 Tax=uncultured Sanguibacteroides sp. TaxID=1635151 RepID=UPI002803C350|nr:hypothetical protein [uncultured Sanguibacteroides sp.]